MSRRIPRPSAALVVAFAALLVALGGTAQGQDAVTAAARLVKSGNLATNAVTSAKVKDGSLLAKDFKRGQLPRGAQGERGPVGPQGAAGATGQTGPHGPSDAFTTAADGQVPVTADGAQHTVASLGDLPAGRYVVVAKAAVNNQTTSERYVTCRLAAGSDADEVTSGVASNLGRLDLESVALTTTHEFAGTGAVTLSCDNSGALPGDTLIGNRVITAIRVGSVTARPAVP